MVLLDSGAEMNIMSTSTFKRSQMPINRDECIGVRVADSNTSPTLGICENVPVDLGAASTSATFFVMENCSNQAILGRPWFRDHLVDMLEQKDGTWVRIKETHGGGTFEFLANKIGDVQELAVFEVDSENVEGPLVLTTA